MKKRKQGSEPPKGFDFVICPNPDCSHILMGVSKDFLEITAQGFDCQKCQQKVHSIESFQDENDPSKLIIRYACQCCKEYFTRSVFVIRHYCSGCKTYYRHYCHALRALTNFQKTPPENQPPAV